MFRNQIFYLDFFSPLQLASEIRLSLSGPHAHSNPPPTHLPFIPANITHSHHNLLWQMHICNCWQKKKQKYFSWMMFCQQTKGGVSLNCFIPWRVTMSQGGNETFSSGTIWERLEKHNSVLILVYRLIEDWVSCNGSRGKPVEASECFSQEKSTIKKQKKTNSYLWNKKAVMVGFGPANIRTFDLWHNEAQAWNTSARLNLSLRIDHWELARSHQYLTAVAIMKFFMG